MTTLGADPGEPARMSAHSAIKLRVPALPACNLRRQRLIDQLDAVGPPGLPGGVIVVHGPAGSGKTSLVADWAGNTARSVSWFTLDERDRLASECWTNLIAAIDRLRPGSLDGFTALLREDVPSDVLADELIVALDRGSGDPAALVLDDFQVVADQPELIGVFRHLVRHLPRGLQLVVISRSLPPLSLDRARLDGRLATIDFDDLRFDPVEAAELLGCLAPDAGEAWVSETIARVDGWAAGLQLFALASGSTDAMQITADYLRAEAFRDEPDELVELLREITVVDRVNVRAARNLSGRDDAGVLLRRAFERDLFLTRRGGDWYELHPLVREVLLAQLGEDPARARALHARAAANSEADGEFADALEHLALAGRHREALRLLSAVHLALYDAGRHDIVCSTIQAMPVDAYATDFAATLEFTWCQVLIDRGRFLDGVARLSWWAQRTPISGVLAARLTLLQSVAATVRGDWVDGGRLARQSMAEVGPEWILDSFGRFGFNMVARDVALSERWHDDDEEVRRADFELVQDPVRRVSFEGIRALGEALAGHPLAALQTAAGVRDFTDITDMAILGDELRLAELVARREVGDGDGIAEALEELATTDVAPTVYIRFRALVELVATHLDNGAIDSARSTLETLRGSIDRTMYGAGVRTLVARCKADVALATDEIDVAERWIGEIDDPFWHPIGRARTCLVRLDHEAARVALDDAVPRCSRHDVVLALLRAVAAGEHEEALKYTTAAVETAVAHGMVQTVAAQGRAAVELVERCAWRAPTGWLDRVRRASVYALAIENDGRSEQSAGIEPLTDRERDVVRFLPSRLTLQEIANELYISMNTLKFHLKVIYRKLGVSSRAEAAEVARQMTSTRTS